MSNMSHNELMNIRRGIHHMSHQRGRSERFVRMRNILYAHKIIYMIMYIKFHLFVKKYAYFFKKEVYLIK